MKGTGSALAVSLAVHGALLAAIVLYGRAAHDKPVVDRGGGGRVFRVVLLRPDDPPGSERPQVPVPPAADESPPSATAATPAPLATPPVWRAPPREDAPAEPREQPATAVIARAEPLTRPASAPPVMGEASDSIGSAEGPPVEVPSAGAPPQWPGPDQVDRPARPRQPIRPRYPARARQRGREGTVVVEAWVDPVGSVAYSSVLDSGGEELDDSARRAVERARFLPALVAGHEVASRVALCIHFSLYD